MVDAICLSMVPPYDSAEQIENNNNNNNNSQQQQPSAFRRSLNLSQSAFGLRRFSRSNINDSNNINPDTTTTTTTNVSPRRRATISATTATSSSTNNTNNESEPQRRPPKAVHVRIVPNIENPSRSLIFDVFDRELQPAVYIKFGRFTDRSQSPTHMSFKSKVVSRSHCEIWVERGKLYIRDTKSSSGTFLNHIRISPPNEESRPYEIRDGDIVQLGVDYQGGVEEIYRSVKMKFEVNRNRRERPVSYTMSAFQNIRNLTTGGGIPSGSQIQDQTTTTTNNNNNNNNESLPMTTTLNDIHFHSNDNNNNNNCNNNNNKSNGIINCIKSNLTTTTNESCIAVDEVEECCICLYALAPYQALFVSPCAHTYHYKCIRPLLESYPGFQCPICRTYSDLEANINMESHEVIEKYGLKRQSTMIESSITHHHHVNETSTSNENNHQLVNNNSNNNNLDHSLPLSSTSSTSDSDSESPASPNDFSPLIMSPTLNYLNENTQSNQPLTTARDRRTIIMDHTIEEQHETNNHHHHNHDNDHLVTDEIEMTTSQGLTAANLNSNHQQQQEQQEIIDNMMTNPDMETHSSSSSTTPPPLPPLPLLQQQQQQQPIIISEEEIQQQNHFSSSIASSSSPSSTRYHNQKRSNGTKFVEKLKMVFLEKRKSSIILSPRERKRSNRPRPLSYPNFLRRNDEREVDEMDDSEEEIQRHQQQRQQQERQINQRSNISNDSIVLSSPATSSYPLSSATTSQILSRQSTHLAEIEEVDELPWHNNFNQFRQPMSVD